MSNYALIDCNNFYASCERAFNPKLEKQGIVVLSNNDGCIIARSNEVKAIGIPMGAPYFKYKDMLERHKVQIFSSNYALYGDMSQRVMSILQNFCSECYVYSIDEAFLNFRDFDLKDFIELRLYVLRCTGIPVSIGIASTKTLAKVASKLAKKTTSGIFLLEEEKRETILKKLPVEDIWGIGRRLSSSLKSCYIHTALQLVEADPIFIKQRFSIQMQRTLYELRGISCIDFDHIKPRKSIIYSRSFCSPQGDYTMLEEAMSHYVAKACERLRKYKRLTNAVQLFLRSRYKDQSITCGLNIPLCQASNDTCHLISLLKKELPKLYEKGKLYSKVGVCLLGLIPEEQQQPSFFFKEKPSRKALMNVLDSINKKMGKSTLSFAAEGIEKKWQMKSSLRSSSYTTSWNELLCIK